MGYISINFAGSSISQKVSGISNLREYNDESMFFSGVFRRSNLELSFENTSQFLNQQRNNKIVELYYQPNNPNLNSSFIFQGLIDEGSTKNDITNKQVSLTVVDALKLIQDVSIVDGDQKKIDQSYVGSEIKLDRNYIINFLEFIKQKGNLNLTFDIALTIESIFPPSDSYYDANNVSALQMLQELVNATNSFMVTERNHILIKPRPISSFTKLLYNEIINISDETDGFNKLYNSIKINNSDPYEDQPSIDSHGVRNLSISTYAAPTEALARTYLDYYKDPKKEMNVMVRLNNRSLALKVGDGIMLNVLPDESMEIQGISGNFFIISREMDFVTETINFRIREA